MADCGEKDSWHLDKKVPLAIILTLVGQLAGFGWIASKLDSRIESLEKADSRHETALAANASNSDDAKQRIIRIEESTKHMLESLARIEATIDRRAR